MKVILWAFLSSTIVLAVLVFALSISTKNISKRTNESAKCLDEQVIDYPPPAYYSRLKYLHDDNDTLFIESDTVLSSY